MTDITKHPLLAKCNEVLQAIEACGASEQLTAAVLAAMELQRGIEALADLPPAQAQAEAPCQWHDEYEPTCEECRYVKQANTAPHGEECYVCAGTGTEAEVDPPAWWKCPKCNGTGRITPVYRVCVAYDQGFTRGERYDDMRQPYAAGTPEAEAYEHGFKRAKETTAPQGEAQAGETPRAKPLVEQLRANATPNHRPKPWPSKLLRQAADALQAANERAKALDRWLDNVLKERDHAQDALQKTHIALGGDGEWCAKLPPEEPPESGDLHYDVPALAEQLHSQLAAQQAQAVDITQIIRDVAELPDRNSPEDQPELMLVSAEELRAIIERHSEQQPQDAERMRKAVVVNGWYDETAREFCEYPEKAERARRLGHKLTTLYTIDEAKWGAKLAAQAQETERTRAELQKESARLDWLEQAARRRKVEIARSLFGTGFEIGEWPEMRATVANGGLREAIDRAMEGKK